MSHTKTSKLDLIQFNIFINHLFLSIKEANLVNFAYDNTIYATNKDMDKLINLSKKESEVAVKQFEENNMFANPEKFQRIIINR